MWAGAQFTGEYIPISTFFSTITICQSWKPGLLLTQTNSDQQNHAWFDYDSTNHDISEPKDPVTR